MRFYASEKYWFNWVILCATEYNWVFLRSKTAFNCLIISRTCNELFHISFFHVMVSASKPTANQAEKRSQEDDRNKESPQPESGTSVKPKDIIDEQEKQTG